MIAAVTLALIAIALAIAAWSRPTSDNSPPVVSEPQFSREEAAKAKAAVCESRILVNEAGSVAGGKISEDPEMKFVLAINIRLSSVAAADYMSAVLELNPAAPKSLSDSTRQLIAAYGRLNLLQMADATEQRLEPAYKYLDFADSEVAKACE